MKPDEILRWLLSWSLMCSAVKPPLYPTTTSILLLTALRGRCTLSCYLAHLHCTANAVRVQVHRLRRLGLLEARMERRNNRRQKVYWLSPQGLSMVYAWVGKTTRTFQRL